MPELPDITVYIEALEKRILGQKLISVLIRAPYLLRTVTPTLQSIEGREATQLRRLGKRICIGFDNDVWLVLHLMIAGRLHWSAKRGLQSRSLAALEFTSGTLTLTEAGSRKRAALHVVSGEAGLQALDPGGADVLAIDLDRFAAILRSDNHTLKRALTDPHLFSGIGNAYSDEILHAAQLSPLALTQKIGDDEIKRLYEATRAQLLLWTDRLRTETGSGFPEKVTAFRKDMAVHGRYREPCPRCGAKVQRIRYAANETNYCPRCQTGGKLLADRSLSRLLRKDWPKTAEELE
ncbi:MAG TPA: DNA-formamidopyrimidine glycosylase family protein [Terriglobales bacterium]|nr:DNA-formamidopyrimidine glycosylase family protein [Terriglobales bacterium]